MVCKETTCSCVLLVRNDGTAVCPCPCKIFRLDGAPFAIQVLHLQVITFSQMHAYREQYLPKTN